MKKYSDWQKYVREQSDKTGPTRGAGADDATLGQRTVQRRGSDSASQPLPPPTRVPKTPVERRALVQREAPRTPAEPAEPSPRAATTLSAPFVSVHDVWKAAEKSNKKATPRIRREERITLPRLQQGIQQSRLPGMEGAAPPAPGMGTPKKTAGQTREEILERLVNPTVSLEEAAKIMGVCKATVRRYTAKGILPHYRTPGNQRRFKLNDIIQFLEHQRR